MVILESSSATKIFFTHKYGKKLKVWFKYSLLNESAWRNRSNFSSAKNSELIYSNPRIPARPEYSTALSKFLYPIKYLKILRVRIYKYSGKNCVPVEIRDIRVMDAVGDILQSLGVHLFIPVQNFTNAFISFLNFCPIKI